MIEEKKEETAREKKNQKPRLFARIGAKRGGWLASAHDCRTRTIDREAEWLGVAVAPPRGRGARDKNGARSTRRGRPSPTLFLFPHKCRVCDAPSTDRPELSCRKNTVPFSLSLSLIPSFHCRHPRVLNHLSMIGRHEPV